MKRKVFYCTAFKGKWPVGTSAVIVARNAQQAKTLLEFELDDKGLKQNVPISEIHELNLEIEAAHVLQDGDY